ncbi:MAG: RdgB/HAM1 family non-canonical purine NTP pyrophosphatase [Pseudomonadota bacterium]
MNLIEGGELLFASHNPGKIAELRELFAPLGVRIVSAADANLDEPEETETTFRGNAALKATAALSATGLPALADDSGLSVHGLGGDPGVYTARWCGPERDFSVGMGKVLRLLNEAGHTEPAARGAAFVAVLALACPGQEVIFFEGRTEGTIADAPSGAEGFGYDPIFVPKDGDGRTFAEMTSTEKHGVGKPLSHRARAVALFVEAVRASG